MHFSFTKAQKGSQGDKMGILWMIDILIWRIEFAITWRAKTYETRHA